MIINFFFFNFYLPTLFRRDMQVDMCVRGGLRVLKTKKDQEEEEAKDWHCSTRVAGLGRLSARANMAMKPFVKRVITVFATNALFLRVISNFRI